MIGSRLTRPLLISCLSLGNNNQLLFCSMLLLSLILALTAKLPYHFIIHKSHLIYIYCGECKTKVESSIVVAGRSDHISPCWLVQGVRFIATIVLRKLSTHKQTLKISGTYSFLLLSDAVVAFSSLSPSR